MKLLIPFTILLFSFSILGCKNTDSSLPSKIAPKTVLDYYNLLPQSPYFDNEISEVTSAQRARGITNRNLEEGYIVGGSKSGPKFTLRVFKGDDKNVILVTRDEVPGSMFDGFFKQLEFQNGKFVEKESRLTRFYKKQLELIPESLNLSVSLISENQIVFLEMDNSHGHSHEHAEIAKFRWNGKEFVETENRM